MNDDLRDLLASLTEGCEPGPWHAERSSDRNARDWWLTNAAGDISMPSPDDVASMVNALPVLLDGIEKAERDRDLAIAHDRQPYPTAFAYERACWAREQWRSRATKAEAALTANIAGLRSPRNSIGKLALPKGLMELAVEDAWEEATSSVGDPADGIEMHNLSILADAIIDHLLARIAAPSGDEEAR